jgi:Transglycosylase SLT domain.
LVLATPNALPADNGLQACDYRRSYDDVSCGEVDRAISESAAEFRVDERRLRRIVRCESRFDPFADSGAHRGLFQQAERYWGGRVREFNAQEEPDAEGNIDSPFDNSRISVRMLSRGMDSHWPNCA